MVIVDSGGGGTNVAGMTSGVPRVVGGAEDVASDVSSVEGAIGASGMISAGISACCACLFCGISGCATVLQHISTSAYGAEERRYTRGLV